MSNVVIYDNDGETVDRYTAVDLDQPTSVGPYGQNYEAVGFSSDPYHPQGVGEHSDALPGPHLGREITYDDLPEAGQHFVDESFGED